MYTPNIIDRQDGQRLFVGKWIDAKSRVPADGVTVIVFVPNQRDSVWIGYVEESVWRLPDGFIVEPTHWMPFPDPPSVPVS